MSEIPFKQATEMLTRDMTNWIESSSVVLAKVALSDGRRAALRLELTADRDVVEDSRIWQPPAAVADSDETGPAAGLSRDELVDMLSDVVRVLNLSEADVKGLGLEGATPAAMVEAVLDQKNGQLERLYDERDYEGSGS